MRTVTEARPAAGAKRVSVDRALRADARRNRQAVVAAAKKLFADQGLDAQMPDVAKAAKVGVGTVYRHFPTKNDLTAALVAERSERLAEKARQCIEMRDAWEGLADFIRFSAQLQADERGLCEVMGSRPESWTLRRPRLGCPELCERLVKRARRSGELRRHLAWEDIPMIACGLGRITQATAGRRDGALAATRRDHPRRPAGTREREAAATALTASRSSGPSLSALRSPRR